MEGERSAFDMHRWYSVLRQVNGNGAWQGHVARPVIIRYLQWVMIEVKYFAATRCTDYRRTQNFSLMNR